MCTAAGHLHDGVNSILFKLPLEGPQIAVSAVVIGVDRDPFRALRHGVDGIEPDGLFSSQVLSNDLLVESQPLFGLTIPRLVEKVLSRLFIRSIGLPEAVAMAVQKSCDVALP